MFDLIVIGSGPGGYIAAIRAAQLGLKTACVEKNLVGGTCLNVGCIPSKCLLESSHLYSTFLHDAKNHGIEGTPSLNFPQMMKRKEQVITSFNQGIKGLFKKNKVELIAGEASFVSSQTISVNGEEYSAKNFILATGSTPVSLPFLPIDEKKVLSSTGALTLKEVPKKMVVVGAGVIGVELGSVYNRLGSEVHFVEFADAVCPTLDLSLSKALEQSLTSQGMHFHLSTKVTAFNDETLSLEGATSEITADKVLVSVGRKPYTKALNLEGIGVTLNEQGFVPIDANFRTSIPHIYAVGDMIEGPMLAHRASEEGVAVAELISGQEPHIEYMAIPSVVYTHPEVASVGLTEQEAKKKNLSYITAQFPFKANSRAQTSGYAEGFVKIIADKESDQFLGMHIFSDHAGELITQGGLAIKKRMTTLEFSKICHPHPTLSEALKEGSLALHKRSLHI